MDQKALSQETGPVHRCNDEAIRGQPNLILEHAEFHPTETIREFLRFVVEQATASPAADEPKTSCSSVLALPFDDMIGNPDPAYLTSLSSVRSVVQAQPSKPVSSVAKLPW